MAGSQIRSPTFTTIKKEGLFNYLTDAPESLQTGHVAFSSEEADDELIEAEFQKCYEDKHLSNKQVNYQDTLLDNSFNNDHLVEKSIVNSSKITINRYEGVLQKMYDANNSQMPQEEQKASQPIHSDSEMESSISVKINLKNAFEGMTENKLEYSMFIDLNGGNINIENNMPIVSKNPIDQLSIEEHNNQDIVDDLQISERNDQLTAENRINDDKDNFSEDPGNENKKTNHRRVKPEFEDVISNTMSASNVFETLTPLQNDAEVLQVEVVQRPRWSSKVYEIVDKDYRGKAPYKRYTDFANADIANYNIGEMSTNMDETPVAEAFASGCTPYLDVDYNGEGRVYEHFSQANEQIHVESAENIASQKITLDVNGAELLAEIFFENLRLMPNAGGGHSIGLVPEVDPNNPDIATLKLNITLKTTPKLIYETISPLLTDILGIPEMGVANNQQLDLSDVIEHLASLLSKTKLQLQMHDPEGTKTLEVMVGDPVESRLRPSSSSSSHSSFLRPKTSTVTECANLPFGIRKLFCLPSFMQRFRS